MILAGINILSSRVKLSEEGAFFFLIFCQFYFEGFPSVLESNQNSPHPTYTYKTLDWISHSELCCCYLVADSEKQVNGKAVLVTASTWNGTETSHTMFSFIFTQSHIRSSQSVSVRTALIMIRHFWKCTVCSRTSMFLLALTGALIVIVCYYTSAATTTDLELVCQYT